MAFAEVGDIISRKVSFSTAEIARFAADVGDHNPLHHDPDYAAATRFGGIIVSGPQVIGHFFSAIASHFSSGTAMVGLESEFKLLAPAYPDTLFDMSWYVTAVTPSAKLGGEIVSLEGTVTDPDGTIVITSTFKALVVDHL